MQIYSVGNGSPDTSSGGNFSNYSQKRFLAAPGKCGSYKKREHVIV